MAVARPERAQPSSLPTLENPFCPEDDLLLLFIEYFEHDLILCFLNQYSKLYTIAKLRFYETQKA